MPIEIWPPPLNFAGQQQAPGGRRVLVIGVIHGNEDDGVAVVDLLRTRPVPEGVELRVGTTASVLVMTATSGDDSEAVPAVPKALW